MGTGIKPPEALFLSYAREDEALRQEFEDHLVILQQAQFISNWAERQVQKGTDWSQLVDPRLFLTDMFVLLLSPSFLASGYCNGAEVREAFARRDKKKTHIIPVLLHSVTLKGSPFEAIQPLPMNAIPVSSWPERRAAWESVERGIREVIDFDRHH